MQEPQLDEDKDVLGNVEEGLGEIKAKLDRFNEIAEQMAADYCDELLDEMGEAAGGHRPRATPGTSTPSSSRPWTRCAARRRTPTCRHALRW